MRILKKIIIATLLSVSLFSLTACSLSGNDDFSYMTERSILKVSIQSTRDQSYKFIVTDKEVINDIYSILSKAMVVDEESTLEPDYILNIYESPTEVKSFKYVAGLDKKDGGNLYNEDSQYIVSKRLDNDIIRNFTNIRKPINFDDMYYESILACLSKFESSNKDVKSIGVNILDDKMTLKFQLSTEIEELKKNIKKSNKGKYIESKEDVDNYDVVMNVSTEGYTTQKYKAIVTFKGSGEGFSTQKYYISNEYKEADGEWKFSISEEEPEGF